MFMLLCPWAACKVWMWAVLLNCREELSYVGCPLISQAASICTFPLWPGSGRSGPRWGKVGWVGCFLCGQWFIDPFPLFEKDCKLSEELTQSWSANIFNCTTCYLSTKVAWTFPENSVKLRVVIFGYVLQRSSGPNNLISLRFKFRAPFKVFTFYKVGQTAKECMRRPLAREES